MEARGDAQQYIEELHSPAREIALAAHEILADALGCSSYVKTIYIGYDLNGEMVAALYGHSDHVEIALSLAEDAESLLLEDAGHLTWRTLPVAAVVRSEEDLSEFEMLASVACERVRSASHDVSRDNDYFIRSRQARRGVK